jgi:hypothetical protein
MRWLLLICVLFAPVLSAQDTDTRAREIVDQPAYRGYRVVQPRQGDPNWWDERAPEREGGTSDWTHEEAGGGVPLREREVRARDPGASSPSMPDWLQSLLEILSWLIMVVAILAVVGGLVYALVKVLKDRKRKALTGSRKSGKGAKTSAAESEESAVTPDGPPEFPGMSPVFADALAAARAELEDALAAGDYARAALVRYRIFWLEAGWTGCVDTEDVTTWRDALRKVRKSAAREHLRRMLRLVENVRYGSHVPDEAEFKAWRESMDRVSARGVLQ